MKVRVSLPDEDVEFLDAYAESHGFVSRSAVLRRAVWLLRATELGVAYEDAWSDWSNGEAELWDVTVADCIWLSDAGSTF